ncbi:hypothetical protein RAS1_41680 [Phycisphaerae bacterium RAS1]|nr:hypothetical protein RAS1_41680 [Phycisphaerae bacterium RAS1]
MTDSMLIAYLLGELTEAEAAEARRAIAADPELTATVARWGAILDAGRSDRSVAPPPATMAAARELFARRSARATASTAAGWLERLRRVIADCTFDSRAQLATVGLRGAADQYQLAYESELADVDLEVQRCGEQSARRVMGQVTLRTGAAPAAVLLTEHGDPTVVTETTADEHGAFSLDIAAGCFDLLVAVGDECVVLPSIEIQ